MRKPQFKGYILEYVLAYILQSSGYTIIDNIDSAEPDLTKESNGLNLQGRGAKHQIDVIGNLDWIPAFTFPTRLLIEAKFKDEKVGINIVREQIGILADINENYFSANSKNPKPRYRYVSAVFSASGFTGPAIDLAIAHQIQLIDMSDDAFFEILEAVNNFTDEVFGEQQNLNKDVVRDIQNLLRKKFFHRDCVDFMDNNHINELKEVIDNFQSKIFIGMSQSGFMLLLYSENGDFREYANHHQAHDVAIHWNTSDSGKLWKIKPVYNDDYLLVFKLPRKLHDWIYKTSENIFESALNEKQKHFSKISIFNKDNDGVHKIFTLKFNKENLNRQND